MDTSLLSTWTSVVSLMVFLGIVFWAWSSSRKPAFEAAARLPLDEEDVVTVQREAGAAR
jgi:cytochrome c oxidase cbb3-type subunit 4